MAKIRLGKTKDSRTRKKQITEDAEIEILQKLKNEQDQPSFKTYILQKGFSLQTLKNYELCVNRFKKWLEKENITETSISYSDVLHYMQSIRNHVKQRTVQNEINAIKHYYNYLQELGLVNENPTAQVQIKGVKRKILYHILKKQELEKLYNDYRELDNPNLAKKRNEIIVSLLVYQGLNTTELSRITVKDLKLREGKIYIAGTRRSNERTLKLESHQVLDFMEYQLQTRPEILKETGKQTDLLFMSFGKSDKFHNVIHKLLKQLKKLNLKVKSVNQIRTSVITHWLKLHNLREVQHMAGHRYVSSTESYLINDLDDLQEEIEKFHPFS